MRLVKELTRWGVYATDKATGEQCRFLVGALSQPEERALWIQVFGRKREQKFKKGWELRETDVEKLGQYNLLRASRVLRESEGCELPVMNEGCLTAYAEALAARGEEGKAAAKALAIGQFVKLDGLWTDAAKQAFLAEAPVDLLDWINNEANDLTARQSAEDDAEGKD